MELATATHMVLAHTLDMEATVPLMALPMVLDMGGMFRLQLTSHVYFVTPSAIVFVFGHPEHNLGASHLYP